MTALGIRGLDEKTARILKNHARRSGVRQVHGGLRGRRRGTPAVKRILLDTNACASFKRGDPGAVEVVQIADRIGMCSVVMGELLAGFACGSKEQPNRRELATFLESPRMELLAIGAGTAEYHARVFRSLRRKGKPVPPNDLWIAAVGLEHGYAVFTPDEHFQAIDGLIAGSAPASFLP
jgi:predicted nucleic acid-binding protein